MELEFNKKQIKNVVYELPNGKIINFKLRNSNLEDVQIIWENKEGIEKVNEARTLEASRSKEWKNHVTPTPTKSLFAKYKTILNEASKELIKNDAEKDADIIKERVKNSNGSNEPLSKELENFE